MSEPAAGRSNRASRRRIIVGIPAYNEEQTIAEVVRHCRRYAAQVVVVDDGSTDLTPFRAQAAGAIVLRHRHNHGKGGAVQTLLTYAQAQQVDTLVMLDGDGQHDPAAIPDLAAPCLRGEADLVVGSRYLSIKSAIPRHRWLGLRAFNFLTALGSGIYCSDSQSGFRALSRTAICAFRITEASFSVECEEQFECRTRGLRLAEVPISCSYAMPEKRSAYTQGISVLCRLGAMVVRRRLFGRIPHHPTAPTLVTTLEPEERFMLPVGRAD